jgi:hypothetical protein
VLLFFTHAIFKQTGRPAPDRAQSLNATKTAMKWFSWLIYERNLARILL